MADLTAQLADAQSEISSLQTQNASISGLEQRYKGSLPVTWVAAATGVCLLVGFLVGIWWVDMRMRKRHGGIRIY